MHIQLKRSQTVSVLLQLLNDFLHGRHLHYVEMMNIIAISCKLCSVLHHLHMHILSLFPVAHYFIISYVHDYSQYTSAFTLITQCLIVPFYPCYVVVVFWCYAPVYITLCTSCNNLQLQSQFNLITPIVILVTRTSLRILFRSAPAVPNQWPHDVRRPCRPATWGTHSTACPRLCHRRLSQNTSLLARRPTSLVRASGGAVRDPQHHQP